MTYSVLAGSWSLQCVFLVFLRCKLLEFVLPLVSCVQWNSRLKRIHLVANCNQILTFSVLSYSWSQLLVYLENLIPKVLGLIIPLVSIVYT